MSNYNLQISWSGKDALGDADPDKIISGDDFDTEFSAVQTAINSKADLNGDASESFSASTATSGTNTTQVATTAFVRSEVLSRVYPVGAIFTTVTAYADSAAVVAAIGGTTWVAFGAGKVLVGVDTGDSDFDTVEETGGSKTHTLTEAEMPSHTHTYDKTTGENCGSGVNINGSNSGYCYTSTASSSAGSGTAHSIMNPYITVYMWKRTA